MNLARLAFEVALGKRLTKVDGAVVTGCRRLASAFLSLSVEDVKVRDRFAKHS